MSWRERLMTSVAKDRPIASGGGEVDWSIRAVRLESFRLLHRSGTHRTHERQPCPDRENIGSVWPPFHLVTGWVAELNVKSGQKAVQSLAWDNDALSGWWQGFMTPHNKEAIICNWCNLSIILTSFMFVSFLEGLVPWTRWAWVQRRSGHSDWTATQAGLLVKGRQTLHWRTSWTETARTTESLFREMKEHTWQVSFSQAAAFRLVKSDGRIAAPEMCLTDAW